MFSLEAYKTLIESIVRTMDNNSIKVTRGSIRMSYSGRGMYGAECLGIVMDSYDMDNWRVDMIDEIADVLKNYKDKDTIALFKKFKQGLKKPSRDSMGLSIIEYHQRITIPKEYADELKEIVKQFIFKD